MRNQRSSPFRASVDVFNRHQGAGFDVSQPERNYNTKTVKSTFQEESRAEIAFKMIIPRLITNKTHNYTKAFPTSS